MPVQISHLFISQWGFFSVEMHPHHPPWPWMPVTCKRQSLVPVCKPFPVAAAVESAQMVSWPCLPALATGDGSECRNPSGAGGLPFWIHPPYGLWSLLCGCSKGPPFYDSPLCSPPPSPMVSNPLCTSLFQRTRWPGADWLPQRAACCC